MEDRDFSFFLIVVKRRMLWCVVSSEKARTGVRFPFSRVPPGIDAVMMPIIPKNKSPRDRCWCTSYHMARREYYVDDACVV